MLKLGGCLDLHIECLLVCTMYLTQNKDICVELNKRIIKKLHNFIMLLKKNNDNSFFVTQFFHSNN